ncbi:hypothetical protein T439DRAFT_348792 [Meredithblackwellia eburnea MCA 4105]
MTLLEIHSRHPFAASSNISSNLSPVNLFSSSSNNSSRSPSPVPPTPFKFPPDEEKGRKFKPSFSSPAILGSVENTIPTTTTSTVNQDQDADHKVDSHDLLVTNQSHRDFSPLPLSLSTTQEEDGLIIEDGKEADDEQGEWDDRSAARLSEEAARSHLQTQNDIWNEAIQTALDQGLERTLIDLSNQDLTFVPSTIGDLASLVSIPLSQYEPPFSIFQRQQPPPSPPHHRTLSRTTSVPIPRTLTRTTTSSSPTQPTGPKIELYLSLNHLTTPSLSIHLFTMLSNSLTVLSLRSNNLTTLPPEIARLVNLTELNLGGNRLRWLPGEVRRLRKLRWVGLHPNPWLTPPSEGEGEGRVLGPIKTMDDDDDDIGGILTLREICTRKVLHMMHGHPSVSQPTPRTRGKTWSSPTIDPTVLPPGVRHAFSLLPSLSNPPCREQQQQPFDPFSSVCHHHEEGEGRFFYKHKQERLEWVLERDLRCGGGGGGEIDGEGRERGKGGGARVPVLWRGCRVGCLDWLERENEVEREGEPETTMGTATALAVGDGFDLDEIDTDFLGDEA